MSESVPDDRAPSDRANADRDLKRDRFLAKHGWDNAEIKPLADDASFRRYFRLKTGTDQVVLMDAPPPQEDVRPFVTIARHLIKLGYSAPQIYAEDEAQGFLLLEDFGDETYTRRLDAGADEEELYARAVDLLIDLHSHAPEAVIARALPPYDEKKLLEEVQVFADWYLPVTVGELDERGRKTYLDCWKEVLKTLRGMPPTLVLRDYHVDNLIWLSGRDGVKACGLLDFQDAVAGPPAYDLMSLLEDARRDIDDALVGHMLARYISAFPDLDTPGFAKAYTILAAQRHTKVIGIFTRLCHRDGKSQYRPHISLVWKLLERALQDPNLGPVRSWMDAHVPAEQRIVPEMRSGVAA